jgi:hypothetical protein
MTIKPEIRARVVELHLQGMKRDDIQSRVGCSTGSIHNILEAYKSSSSSTGRLRYSGDGVRQNESILQERNDLPSPSKYTDDSIIHVTEPQSSIRHNGDWHKAVISAPGQAATNTNSNVVKRNGGPFSNLLGKDEDTTVAVNPDPDSDSTVTNTNTSVPPAPTSSTIPESFQSEMQNAKPPL